METEGSSDLCTSSSEAEEASHLSPLKKKKIANRRKNKFNDTWKKHFNWIGRTNEETMAKCIACGLKFSIAYGGICAIKRHMKTMKHTRNMERSHLKPNSAFLSYCSNSELSETFQVDAENSKTSPTQKVPNEELNTKDPGESDSLTDNCKDDAHDENVQTSRAMGKYQCFICSFNCNKQSYLSRHLKIHFKTKSPPFVCTVCKKQFSRKQTLVRHINLSAEIRLYQCEECDKSFADKSILKIHWKETHSGMKPFKCTKCDYETVVRTGLTKHMAVHMEDRPFKCLRCSYAAKCKKYLDQHIKTHTHDRPYQCYVCEFRFLRADHLRQHLKRKHS